jgi:hypothetical protein
VSVASFALVGKLSGAYAGVEAAAGPSRSSTPAVPAPGPPSATVYAAGVLICGCASLVGALVTLLLVWKNAAWVVVGAQAQTASVQPLHAERAHGGGRVENPVSSMFTGHVPGG